LVYQAPFPPNTAVSHGDCVLQRKLRNFLQFCMRLFMRSCCYSERRRPYSSMMLSTFGLTFPIGVNDQPRGEDSGGREISSPFLSSLRDKVQLEVWARAVVCDRDVEHVPHWLGRRKLHKLTQSLPHPLCKGHPDGEGPKGEREREREDGPLGASSLARSLGISNSPQAKLFPSIRHHLSLNKRLPSHGGTEM